MKKRCILLFIAGPYNPTSRAHTHLKHSLYEDSTQMGRSGKSARKCGVWTHHHNLLLRHQCYGNAGQHVSLADTERQGRTRT